jgi:hypothetical protein
MFRTSIKIIGTVLAVAAVAAPVASAGSHSNLPSNKQMFSLGTELAKYQQKSKPTTPRVGEGFSLGVPLEYQQRSEPTTSGDAQIFSLGTALFEYQRQQAEPRTPRVGEGFSLGAPGSPAYDRSQGGVLTPPPSTSSLSGVPPTRSVATPAVVVQSSGGFDWSAAGIGAGSVAGVFLLIGGIGSMTIRARKGQRVGLSAT